MEEILKMLMSKAFSDQDILKPIDNTANLVTYKELVRYRSLNELLGKHRACVILYDINQDSVGHWTVLIEHYNGELEFFDPYATAVDDWLQKAHPSKRQKYHNHLTRLIYEDGRDIIYNDKVVQQMKDGINTCGRHVLCRLLLRDIAVDDYINIITTSKYKPDELVTLMTFFS